MRLLSQAELDGKLAEILDRLCNAFAPVAICLYGSYACGTPNRHSDIDPLVVVEDSNLNPYKRDAAAYRALSGLGVAKDVQVYTRDEFEQRAALTVSFERTVKKKGRRLDVT